MKLQPFTIIAACQCGCCFISAFPVKASDRRDARKRHLKLQDPEWPMKVLVVIEGEWTTE